VSRALLVVSAAAALLAPRALAHVTVQPAGIESGTTRVVTLETPSERKGAATTRLVLVVPDRLEIASVSAPDGWEASHDGSRAIWTGGSIAEGDTVGFPVELAATGAAGSVTLEFRQGYDDGTAVVWKPSVTVLPAVAAAPEQHLGRALVASAIGLGFVALSLAVLRRARRRPPRDA